MPSRESLLTLAPVAALVAASLACGTSSLEVLGKGGSGADGGLDGAGPAPSDAAVDATMGDGGAAKDASSDGSVEASPRAAYCSGTGSPIVVASGDSGSAFACLGGLSQTSFRWAVCTCDAIVGSAPITTDSFNGSVGAYDAGVPHSGGGVGTNGNLSAGAISVGGTLWVSDSTGMTVTSASAEGELHVGGRVSIGPSLSVSHNAYVLGNIVATGDVTVGGTLHQPAGDTVNAATKSISATSTAEFTVPAACDCDPTLRVDVAGYVASYAANNDDSVAGIDPRELSNVMSPLTLPVPCGRIYFTSVGGTGAMTLQLQPGRTAIFIGGDLAPAGDFALVLPAGGEVDVFVAGGVSSGGTFTLGSSASPARARLWVGGSGTVNFSSAATLAGNVYAPQAELVLGAGATTVYGSIFAKRLSATGSLTVHYDESILDAGGSCTATTSCTTCRDCGNQACVAGGCGACTQSSDCCAPLVCSAGSCVISPP